MVEELLLKKKKTDSNGTVASGSGGLKQQAMKNEFVPTSSWDGNVGGGEWWRQKPQPSKFSINSIYENAIILRLRRTGKQDRCITLAWHHRLCRRLLLTTTLQLPLPLQSTEKGSRKTSRLCNEGCKRRSRPRMEWVFAGICIFRSVQRSLHFHNLPKMNASFWDKLFSFIYLITVLIPGLS